MGQAQSGEAVQRATPEQLSHELALRFATKCFSPLELTHLKDNFKSLADQNDGLKYWKEDTLCRFLCLPDKLGVGPVIYHMATYLGAFPFPSLAPSILTLEAIVKVVVIMTERYSRILKRGRKDRIKLLFRSLAVYDRMMSMSEQEKEKPTMEELVAEQKPDDMVQTGGASQEGRSHVAGFAIDEPIDDMDEDEDDDELALAALDSLDAIEVFREDQRIERKIHQAQIPVENLKRLVLFLLVISPLRPQENIAKYGEPLSDEREQQLMAEADSIVAAFEPNPTTGGVSYRNFTKALSFSVPYLFESLNSLFEHFLFSKNIDLSKKRGSVPTPSDSEETLTASTIVGGPNQELSLNEAMLAHFSTFLTLTSATNNIFHSGTRFHSLYSSYNDGTSLSSFSRQVLSWRAPTILLVTGSSDSISSPITIGVYLPYPWSKPSDHVSTLPYESPSMFLVSPRHAFFPANPYHKPSTINSSTSSAPFSHFSTKAGISIGCIIPPSSRTSLPQPIPGPVSLQIGPDLESVLLTYTPEEGSGAFLPDPTLPQITSQSTKAFRLPRRLKMDLESLSVFGVNIPAINEEDDELTRQRKRLAWEEAEAERRRGVNFGGDKDGARALLEMAGIVGGGNRSGGSMG